MPKPLRKRSPQNIVRRKARAAYERSRAGHRDLAQRSGTGYFAMHNGATYQIARKRFTREQLLENGHPIEKLLRQGVPPKELTKLFPHKDMRAAVRRVVAERMVEGHRTRDIRAMKKNAGIIPRKRKKQ